MPAFLGPLASLLGRLGLGTAVRAAGGAVARRGAAAAAKPVAREAAEKAAAKTAKTTARDVGAAAGKRPQPPPGRVPGAPSLTQPPLPNPPTGADRAFMQPADPVLGAPPVQRNPIRLPTPPPSPQPAMAQQSWANLLQPTAPKPQNWGNLLQPTAAPQAASTPPPAPATPRATPTPRTTPAPATPRTTPEPKTRTPDDTGFRGTMRSLIRSAVDMGKSAAGVSGGAPRGAEIGSGDRGGDPPPPRDPSVDHLMRPDLEHESADALRAKDDAIAREEALTEAKGETVRVLKRLIVPVVGFHAAMLGLPKAVHTVTESYIDHARALSEFSGAIAGSVQTLEAQQIGRQMRMAQSVAGSTQRMTQAQNRLENALLPYAVVMTDVQQRILALLADNIEGVLNALKWLPTTAGAVARAVDAWHRHLERQRAEEVAPWHAFLSDLAGGTLSRPGEPESRDDGGDGDGGPA